MITICCKSCGSTLELENSVLLCKNKHCNQQYIPVAVASKESTTAIFKYPNGKTYIACLECYSSNVIEVNGKYVCSDCGNGTLDLLKPFSLLDSLYEHSARKIKNEN